jgi:hypothetical protein
MSVKEMMPPGNYDREKHRRHHLENEKTTSPNIAHNLYRVDGSLALFISYSQNTFLSF